MPLTLEEITAYQERLRTDIVERECVLAGLEVVRNYVAKGDWPQSLELGPLAARLLYPVKEVSGTPMALPAPAPADVPPRPAPPPRKINPELEQLRRGHGGDTSLVKWAIARMTDDYSLLDIAALLKSEGYGLFTAKISVVLTRLKSRGEIDEIKRGSGPKPAIFRKPENPIPLVKEPADPLTENEDPLATNAGA